MRCLANRSSRFAHVSRTDSAAVGGLSRARSRGPLATRSILERKVEITNRWIYFETGVRRPGAIGIDRTGGKQTGTHGQDIFNGEHNGLHTQIEVVHKFQASLVQFVIFSTPSSPHSEERRLIDPVVRHDPQPHNDRHLVGEPGAVAEDRVGF